jgi:hypothetical protein
VAKLRINRGTANVAVERLQLPPHLTQIKEPAAKDVILRNVLIQTKIVEQPLRWEAREAGWHALR